MRKVLDWCLVFEALWKVLEKSDVIEWFGLEGTTFILFQPPAMAGTLPLDQTAHPRCVWWWMHQNIHLVVPENAFKFNVCCGQV